MKRKLTLLLTAVLLLTGMSLQAQTYTWESTPLSELASSDVFVIVGNNGSNYAMTNDNGTNSAPATIAVTVIGNSLTGTIADNIQWTISGNATDGYTFYPNGSTSTWLYCTSSNNGVRVGTNTNNTFHLDASGYLVHNSTGRYIGIYNSQDWRCYTSINTNIQNQAFAFYKKVSSGGSTPSINASNQNIAYDATSGSIPYSISNPTSATLSASCDAEWVSDIEVTSNTVTFNTTVNTANTERVANFTLTYTGATDKTVTVTQAAAPVVYTTIPELFAAATSTSTNVSVTFNNWVVSAVKGNNAYLTDNQGNGLIIYQSGHGFQVNDVLSGTASCKLVTYQGSAELTNLKTTTEGLTVTAGGTLTEQSIAISTLGGVNTGALLHFDALTYNGTAFVDANNNTIEPYTQLYSGYTLETNKIYNVTGIYKQYTTSTTDKKQILPRNAADIVEVVATPTLTVSTTSLTAFTYTESNGPSTAQNFTVSGSDLTADVTVTAPTNFEVCDTENGTYSSSMSITASGTLAETTVYVRMAAGLSANTYSGDLTVASTDATSQTVALSGEVTPNTPAPVTTYTFKKVSNHAVVAGRLYLIVDANSGRALTSANGTSSAPSAVEVTILNNDSIVASDTTLMWTFASTDGGYIIYPKGENSKWLYTTNTNNGVRIGDDANKVWTLNITDPDQPNYHGFKNNSFGRYLGVYSNQDWRTYNTIHNNIKNTQIELFEYNDNSAPVLNPELIVSTTSLAGFHYTYEAGPSQSKTFTVSGSDLSTDVTVTAPTHYELSISRNNGYFDNVSLSPVNGTLAETTLHVRLKADLEVGSYLDTLTVTCDSLSHSVALSGSVGEQPTVAAPTFSPAAGSFITAQTVSMSCETDSVTIYYTTDGTEPTSSSNEYSEPITVSSTTTIKAIAVKPGYQNSSVTEATYTIHETISIAAARALANDEYACVEGVVIFIDGRNVHVQDATAGIDLYLNSNAPSSLQIGDMVRAYGKKTVYNHLVELTSINATNANVFSVISTGNALPEPAVQTIAEINSDFDGDNMMQSTHVSIETAIIGAINTSGNTTITQDGSSLNIYRIPSVPGMIQGDWVTLTGIVCCHNGNLQLRVINADDIQFTHRPVLAANPTSISGLTYEYEQGGPSDIASFGLSGDYLTNGVGVYPSENFEVSTFSGNFLPENPAMVFSNSGHFSNINIYVRLKANLEGGTYNEQIYAVSENADTLFINVTGTVTGGTPTPPDPPTPPTPGDGNYVRISSLDQLTEGSIVVFAARFDGNATDYYAMSNTSSGKPEGVLFTSAVADENEVLPASIVDEESSYYWTVGVTANGYTFTNAANELIGYGSGTNFTTGGDNTEWSIELSTAGDGAMVPEYTGFVVSNVNNSSRAFALNNNHNFGPYSTQNLNGSSYNFYLDLFVKTEGGEPPVPPTPTVATPTFTPAAGTYYEAQTVSIECGTEGASIYYTLDGTDPDESSTLYSTPLVIDATTTVKAIAIMEGYNSSDIAEATYTIQLGFATIFNQDWEGEMNGWTFVDVEGEMEWTIATYQGNHYAYANGYNHGANEDWCISPAFNLDAYDNPMLSFRTATKFDGNVLQVMFSNDYDGEDPTTATWTELTCTLSTGNYTWVESGSIDLSNFSGSECYIGFKYTCEESQAAAWEVDDILLLGQTSEPVVTVTPLVLTGFTYMEGNGPSNEQSFTVSGLNLTGDVTINNAAHYEISLTSGTNFNTQSTITLAPVAGNIEETTIYVRLMAGLAVGDYNDEDITMNCVDVEDIEVTCSGNVTEQPVPGDDYVRISDVSQLAAGNRVILAGRYNETGNTYLAIANTLTSGKFGTTEFTSAMNGNDEIIPAEILLTEDDYYWTVDVTADGYTFTNANGQVLSYGSGTNFNFTGSNTAWTIETGVSDTAAMVPEYFGFNIANFNTSTRAFAIRYYNEAYICGAYSTSNMNNGEYNFFLDIFMQGEGGVPPTPTVAMPTFTPAAGTYYETIDVTINCATDGATIYYSLDSETGPWEEYEEAITVDEDMTIWAYASKAGYNDSPVVSAEYVIEAGLNIIFWQEWENDWDPWHGWTEVCQEGDSLWHVASYGGNHYAYANGYNHPQTIDWLISPAFDLDSYSDVVLTFNTAKNYNGPDLEVFFSNDYDGQDPTTATWQELECELSQGGWNWVASGDISLDEFSGTNCYIGFKYTSEEDAAGWEVDDIKLASGSTSPTPTLIATPNYLGDFSYVVGHGPSESQSYVLSGVNLNDEGYIHIVSCSWYEISLDNETFTEILEFPCTELPATVYVRMMEGLEPNTYDGVYIANIYGYENDNANVAVNVSGIVHYENEPTMSALMPLYVQGNNGSNNNRVPVAVPVHFNNLEPNTTYHYTNQFVDDNDGPETAGAGNVIYADPEGFYRSTSPSLSTEGGYGEFTTDDEGHALVWLMNEPTANARFTPGNHVYLRVRLNDGAYGVNVLYTLTSEDYATVLNFGTENDEYSGTAFYVRSNDAPMGFAQLYAVENEPRPIYSTSIETTGVDYGSINQYADFYKDLVAGKDGWFGGILPNVNNDGVNFILTFDIYGELQSGYASMGNGQWAPEANTINPTNGLDEPIFIDLFDDGIEEPIAANVKVWSADQSFVIENSDECNYTMSVVNMLGQTMMTREIAAGSTVRVNHNLTTGIYIINLQNSQNKVAVKVLAK